MATAEIKSQVTWKLPCGGKRSPGKKCITDRTVHSGAAPCHPNFPQGEVEAEVRLPLAWAGTALTGGMECAFGTQAGVEAGEAQLQLVGQALYQLLQVMAKQYG